MNKDNNNKGLREVFAFDESGKTILNTVEELISMAANDNNSHALIKDDELYNFVSNRYEVSDLVKNFYNLPKTDLPDVVESLEDENQAEEDTGRDFDPFLMVNLISSNYRLPETDLDDFLR